MHETAVAESIVQIIIQQSQLYPNTKPVRARISCGQFNRLNDEMMQEAFAALSRGTCCEGMRLEIRHIPLQARCEQCQTTFEYDIKEPFCPQCNSDDYQFLPDAPLLLEELEFEPI